MLGALSGLKLPSGTGVTTKSPIRISINADFEGVKLYWPTGGTRLLGSDGLDLDTYEGALSELQEDSSDLQKGGVGAALMYSNLCLAHHRFIGWAMQGSHIDLFLP